MGNRGGGIQETSKTLKQRINESKDGEIIDAGKEEIDIKDGDSYTIDKAITIRNCDAKSGTFIVEATGARFENLRNIESIIADERLGEGDLDIRNCFEIDSVYVNGGGSHSIRIASTHIKNLYVAKEDVRVLLQAEGTNAAKVENVQISKNCKLESEDASAVFEQVQISADVEKVTLAGSATVQKILAETVVTEESTEETKAKVEIESAEVKIDATSANVELKVSENADANVTVPKTQIIDKTFKVTTVVNGETSSLAVYEGYKFNFKPGDADSGFAGWYSDAAFTTKIELPYLVTKDVTLYAKFVELEAKFFVVSNGVASSADANKYYSDVTVGKVEGATIATTADYDVITVDNATATSDVWSVWADSLENWNFKANKNYKISVDVKADVESVILLQAKPINASYANQKNVKVTTEWQTVEIETGCWNKDFLGYLQVVCGQSKKTYLRNLKMQEVSTKTIPTGVWGPNADSISVTQVENGVKFAFGKDSAAEWENGAAIRGTFVETSKNYLYKVKFTAAADENNVKFYYSADSWAEDNAWGSATIGKTATNIELYIPAYQLDGDELRGAEINISIPTKNSVTITNVKFESLTAIPSNQVIFFTSDYKVHKKITSTGKDNYVVLDVAANSEADLRFVMEKATNSKIEWNNSCSFSKFVNKTSATVSIPEGKDYLVLKNTSNTSQTYRLYIDETWTIVIEDATTDPSVEYTVKYVSTEEVSGIFMESETLPAGTVHELPQLDDIPDDDYPKRFGGWYEGVTVNEYGSFDWTNSTKVSSSYTVTKDVTLYAAWVMDVTLTFVTGYEADGIIVDPIKTETYAKINLPTPTAPAGMDIVFEGWYYDGDNDDEIKWDCAVQVSSPYTVGRPATLFAKWKLIGAPDFFANKAAVTKTDEYGNIIRDDSGNIVILESAIVDSSYTEQANRYKYQDYIAGTVNGVTISKNDSENIIKNTNYVSGTSTEWDYWLASVESFDMNANQNYKVSLDIKADSEKDIRILLKDYYASGDPAIITVVDKVTTEWKTIELETGVFQGDWKGFFEIPIGLIDSLYVRNLKVETVDTEIISVSGNSNSVIYNKSRDGFTAQISDTAEYIGISGIKSEYGKIYSISFDVSSINATTMKFHYKGSTANYADGGAFREISSTPINVTVYVPNVGSDFMGIGYNFMSLGFFVTDPTTVTVSNFKVETVDKSDLSMIPSVYLTTDWGNYAELTPCENGESYTTVEVLANGSSGSIFALTQDPWIGELKWEGTYIDLRTSIKADEYANFYLIDNYEGRAYIVNNNNQTAAYKIWINKNYEIVVEETSYQVTFDLNGGTVDGSGSNITIETIGLSVVTPVKEGYIFKGWTETKDGDDYITSATSDMTVYAKWVSQLQLFEGGDVTGDFAVVQDDTGKWVFSDETGISFVSEGDGVYFATFTYQDYMIGWGSPVGTCQFKARTVAGSWDGVSYGIADSNNQPVIDGEAVSSIAGKDSNIKVSGFVVGTRYKITFTCFQDGSVTVQVSTVTE